MKYWTLWVALIFLGSATGVASGMTLIDGSELSNRQFYDEIPQRVGERVVLNSRGRPASGLAFVIDMPSSKALELLVVGSKWIDRLEVEKVEASEVKRRTEGYTQSSTESLRLESEKFRRSEINAEIVRDWLVIFRPYNVHIPTQERSTLVLRIADSTPIFGSNCLLGSIDRVDRTYVNLRTFHLNIPLPGKEHSEINIVTDTELRLIDDIEKRLGAKVIGTVLLQGLQVKPYQIFEEMQAIGELAKRCGR